MLDERVLYAWAAGFFDGEGHIARINTNSFQVVVEQRVNEPLLRLTNLFGGTIYERQRSTAANKSYVGVDKPIFRWVLQHRPKVIFALSCMLPYLTVKEDKALEALNHLNSLTSKPYNKGEWSMI